MNVVNQILDVFNGGRVRRLHTSPTIRDQTVADHSWGVTVLVHLLWPNEGLSPALFGAIYHDVAEYVTGDVPAPAKWASHDLKMALEKLEAVEFNRLGLNAFLWQMDERDLMKLKVADTFELMLFSLMEMEMGNSTAALIFERLRDRSLNTFMEDEEVGENAKLLWNYMTLTRRRLIG